jgi:glycosyltransferase involved in cell wall biosynthesis
MVANFGVEKDHALFVEIAADLVRRRPDVHFVLVGTGPLRDETERALKQRGIADQVTMMRTVAELPDLYRLMSVFLLCSRSEGFPNVVLEAMAAGKPVVAASVGGIPEVIEDGVTGRLIATRAPEDFATAIDAYLENPAEAEATGQRAARSVEERFSVQRMGEKYRALYAELLASARQRRNAG